MRKRKAEYRIEDGKTMERRKAEYRIRRMVKQWEGGRQKIE
jgi:hypothetical protein